MSANSSIEWCDHTFNPWWGCAKVSPGCKNCYAETHTKRFAKGDIWGIHADRRFFGNTHWNKPFTWNESLKGKERMERVFCASMADVFEEHQDPHIQEQLNQARERLFAMIEETTNLYWLLLTKRPENINKYFKPKHPNGYLPFNVCVMTSVENQQTAEQRIPHLKRVRCLRRGLSVEPLLSEIDLSTHLFDSKIDWVIVGGESGPKARRMNPYWVRRIRNECRAHEVNFFFKQWGTYVPVDQYHGDNILRRCLHKVDPGVEAYHKASKSITGRILDGQTYDAHPFVLNGPYL